MRKFRFYAKNNHVGFTIYGSRIVIRDPDDEDPDTWFWIYDEKDAIIFGGSSAVIEHIRADEGILWKAIKTTMCHECGSKSGDEHLPECIFFVKAS